MRATSCMPKSVATRGRRGIERLLAIGEGSRFSVEAFGRGGQWFADIDALIREAKGVADQRVAVLIKGSRANRLERVSAALSAWRRPRPPTAIIKRTTT